MEYGMLLHHLHELTTKMMKRYWMMMVALALLMQACSSQVMDELNTEQGYNMVSDDMEKSSFTKTLAPQAEMSFNAALSDKKRAAEMEVVASKQPDKIIKTGRISIEVKDYSRALAALKNTIATMDGYIASENEQRNNYSVSNTLVIRVVNSNFDKLMDGIANEAGKLLYKNVDLLDVTEEFTDLTARMKTKKEVEQRYIDILRTARTVKDILLVEEQLRVIREEIESTEARLKYLGDKVQYSTITLDMSQELDYNPPAPMQVSFFDKLGKAIKGGWNGLLGGVLGLVNAWPIVLVILVLIVFIRRWMKKRAAVKA